jgi:hypothetical protein
MKKASKERPLPDVIAIDFQVTKLVEHPPATLYYAPDELYHKFVIVETAGFGNVLSQYYAHRHELATFVSAFLESGNERESRALSALVTLTLEGTREALSVTIQTPSIGTGINITKAQASPFTSIILKDCELLSGIRLKQPVGGTSSKSNPEVRENVIQMIRPADVELIAFEKAIAGPAVVQDEVAGVSPLYKVLLNSALEISDEGKQRVIDEVAYMDAKKECDCGNPDCGFEQLKATKEHFLGTTTAKEVETEWDLTWQSLPERQKAAVVYLNRTFNDSPLFNASFLLPSAKNQEAYDRLVTGDHQPDSAEARWIHQRIASARYFLSLEPS